MPGAMRIGRVIVSVLLIVLVLATTMGVVLHHHDRSSTDGCTLCHMVIAPPAAAIGTIGLAPTPAQCLIWQDGFVSQCRTNQKAPRAPPV
jgi:hypothetical protein